MKKMKTEIRVRHYSLRTEQSYEQWIRRFFQFHKQKAADVLSSGDIKEYLDCLAVERNVAGSTQNQALNALVFFYQHVLGRDIGTIREKRPHHYTT